MEDLLHVIHTPDTVSAMDDHALIHYFGDLKIDTFSYAEGFIDPEDTEIPEDLYDAYEVAEAELLKRLR